MKKGDFLKNGNYMYKIFKKDNGNLYVNTKYFGDVDVDKFMEVMHNNLVLIEKNRGETK